jgi:hypothetical protein
MRGVALLLPACMAVAGCGGADTHANGTAQAATGMIDPEKVMAERWQSVFGDPAKAIAAANEFGYKAGAYAAKAGSPAYGAAGAQVLPDAEAPIAIATSFAAAGGKPDRIDTITFSFDVTRNGKPKTKKEADAAKSPGGIVGGFLSRFEVGTGDDVRQAIAARASTEVELHGVTIKVAGQPLPGGKSADDRRLVVTLSNSEAQASS